MTADIVSYRRLWSDLLHNTKPTIQERITMNNILFTNGAIVKKKELALPIKTNIFKQHSISWTIWCGFIWFVSNVLIGPPDSTLFLRISFIIQFSAMFSACVLLSRIDQARLPKELWIINYEFRSMDWILLPAIIEVGCKRRWLQVQETSQTK